MHYLYRTIVKKERSVSERLVELGCDVFYPTIEGQALFPGYMFVNEENANPYELSRVPGSLGIVSFGAQQAMVPDHIVDGLRGTEWEESERYTAGSKVWIKEGPFRFREAIVKEKRADRIIVLLKILQQDTEKAFKLSEIEAA